jgi:hypothetical protein
MAQENVVLKRFCPTSARRKIFPRAPTVIIPSPLFAALLRVRVHELAFEIIQINVACNVCEQKTTNKVYMKCSQAINLYCSIMINKYYYTLKRSLLSRVPSNRTTAL